MSRYRRVEVGTFNDDRFRELSSPGPNAQDLWLQLLCGPRTTIFPGLVIATEAVLASDLGWPIAGDLFGGSTAGPSGLREAWGEISSRGMAVADWVYGVIVLPRALLDRRQTPRETARPTSPNAFRGWAKAWGDVPECALSAWYLAELGRFAGLLDAGNPPRGIHATPYSDAYRQAFATQIERFDVVYRDQVPPEVFQAVNASNKRSRVVNAFETRRIERNQGVNASTPSDSKGLTRLERVEMSNNAELTRLEPARDPVPVPESLAIGLSDPRGGSSGSGDPAVLKPSDARGSERSPTAPSRKAYPPRDGGRSGSEPTPATRAAPTPPPAAPPGLWVQQPSTDPEQVHRRELGDQAWDRLNALRAQIATERSWRDVRPLHPMDPGRTELASRLRELNASREELAAQLDHVFAVAEAEARAKDTVRWLTGSMFEPARWSHALGMRVADAVRVRSTGTGKAPAREYAGAREALDRERREAAARAAAEPPPPDDEPLTDDDREAIRELARGFLRTGKPATQVAETPAEPDGE